MNEDDQSDDTACHNPQCVLEDYLIDISQPPKLPSKEIPEKLPKETMSPNKENVPPISNQVCKDLKKKLETCNVKSVSGITFSFLRFLHV